jgi:hypothetical protein
MAALRRIVVVLFVVLIFTIVNADEVNKCIVVYLMWFVHSNRLI